MRMPSPPTPAPTSRLPIPKSPISRRLSLPRRRSIFPPIRAEASDLNYLTDANAVATNAGTYITLTDTEVAYITETFFASPTLDFSAYPGGGIRSELPDRCECRRHQRRHLHHAYRYRSRLYHGDFLCLADARFFRLSGRRHPI